MLKKAWAVGLLSLPMMTPAAVAAPCSGAVGGTSLQIKVDFPLFEPEDRKLLVTVNGPVSREAVVEADQVLSLAGVTPGRYTISILRPGFTLASGSLETSQTIADGECQQVILSLKGAQTISGILYDALAKPISGVQVKLSRAEDTVYTKTDATGRFTFRGVTPGPYWISTGSDGFAEQFYPVVADQDEASVIYVRPGEDVENVRFSVPHVKQARAVSVRIVKDDGSPAIGAKAVLKPARGEDRHGVEGTADAQGRVAFQAFAETPYVLIASDPQGTRSNGSLEIPAGVTPVEGTVHLRPATARFKRN